MAAVGTYFYFFPPLPAVVKATGDEDKEYAPNVIGLDADGWLWLNGSKYAAPKDGRFDEVALLEVAWDRLRWREKNMYRDLVDWQVLTIEPDVPMGKVDAFLECLRQNYVPNTCFDVSSLTDALTQPRLLHAAREMEMLRPMFCTSETSVIKDFLFIRVHGEAKQEKYSWGYDSKELTASGGLDTLRKALSSGVPKDAYAMPVAGASWADLLRVLCAIEDAGLFDEFFPYLTREGT